MRENTLAFHIDIEFLGLVVEIIFCDSPKNSVAASVAVPTSRSQRKDTSNPTLQDLVGTTWLSQ